MLHVWGSCWARAGGKAEGSPSGKSSSTSAPCRVRFELSHGLSYQPCRDDTRPRGALTGQRGETRNARKRHVKCNVASSIGSYRQKGGTTVKKLEKCQ